ncbi:MAG: trypsin-like peptidase domain-containing protein [Streptosporangiaceae bacterium]
MQEDQTGSDSQRPEYIGPWSPTDSPASQQPEEPAGRDAAAGSEGPAAGAAGPGGGPDQPGPTAPLSRPAGGFAQPEAHGQGPAGYPGEYGQPQPGGGYARPPAGGAYAQPPAGGYPQGSGYGQGSYGQPGGYGEAQPGGYGEPQPGGYGQPQPGGYGEPQTGGYGQPQTGGYDQAPAGGYGQPPAGGYPQAGGYGQGPYAHPGGYGPPGGGYGPPGDYIQQGPSGERRRFRGLVTYVAVAALAAGIGAGTVFALKDGGSPAAQQSSGSGLGGSLGLGNGSGTGNGSGLGNGSGFGNGTGNGTGNASGTAVSNATLRSVKAAVQPGLVDITSNLHYENGTAAATGMVVSSNGIVLTNNHVIDDSTGLTATVVDTGRRYSATVRGYDKSDDVAVIQLAGASGLQTVPLGDSGTVKLGDQVVAIGNADGTGGAAVVGGSITALNQTITASDQGSTSGSETLHGMLQTNADIIPGDSGGPLASAAGKVIGMDTAAASGSFGDTEPNVGFAIPINRALSIEKQIVAGHGSSSVQIGLTGFIGVLVWPTTQSSPRAQQQLQAEAGGALGGGQACLSSDVNAPVPQTVAPVSKGALVDGVLCGTPAAQKGLAGGDVITAVNGQAISSPTSLTGVMQQYRPGATVSISWADTSGGQHTSSVQLLQAPPR